MGNFTEDQQALEDEGLVFPLKSNVAPSPQTPHLPNIFHRNQNTAYFQPHTIAASPNLPLYLANSQLAMMNYFNTTQSALRAPQQHHIAESTGHEQFLQQHIPVDMVIRALKWKN